MKICLCKAVYYLLLITYCTIGTQAQSTLLGAKNWQTVLSGSILSKLEESSYGFVVITEGKLLNAFSENGVILWQRSLLEPGEGFCSSMDGDFMYTAINKSLSLYNTSGSALWTIKTKTPIIEKPLPGWDGRVFVRENTAISSYNLLGLLRFRLVVNEGTEFPLMTLNDGSILYIQKKELDGKSTALRISPFGNIIEEIIFVDRIVAAKEGPEGVILGLENGSLALCQVINDIADTGWSIKIQNKTIQNVFPWNENILTQCTDGSFILFDGKHKEALWIINNLDKNKVQSTVFNTHTFLVLTEKSIISLQKDGIVEKSIHLETLSRFSSLTSSGLFVEAKNDWSISAYRIALLKNTMEEFSQGAKTSFSKKYATPPPKVDTIESYAQAPFLFKNESLFQREAALLSRLRIDMQNIQTSYLFEKKPTQSYENMSLKMTTMEIASYLGTAEAKPFFETILEKESDDSVLFYCLKAIQRSPYDYDMGLLRAIEGRLMQSGRISDTLLQEYCYTITEICRFMGRKVLIKKGKDLLFAFLDSKYSTKVQNTARFCLEKVITFEK